MCTYTLSNVCLINFGVICLTLTCNASCKTMNNKLLSSKTWTEPKLNIKQSIPYIHWYNKTITLSSIKTICVHNSFLDFILESNGLWYVLFCRMFMNHWQIFIHRIFSISKKLAIISWLCIHCFQSHKYHSFLFPLSFFYKSTLLWIFSTQCIPYLGKANDIRVNLKYITWCLPKYLSY